jgi:hypothetical protein
MKFMNMNMHISKRHLYLILIVVGAIVLYSFMRGPREGFNNYIANGTTSDEYNSYVAPAGNTVLYNKDDQAQGQGQDQHQVQGRRPKKQNWSRNDGPLGIPRSQIPDGDEDLYILKTAVIPPVCPACPNVTVCPNNSNSKAPPPCPPCARCPEPAFDCKKVPNYNSNNNDFLPRPVLADFSQFGM